VKGVERKHIAIGHKSLRKRYHGLWQENEIFPVVLNHVWRKDMMESWTHKPVYTKEKTSHGCKMGLDSCGDGTHKFCHDDIKKLCPN
jgi:hypothetical protein